MRAPKGRLLGDRVASARHRDRARSAHRLVRGLRRTQPHPARVVDPCRGVNPHRHRAPGISISISNLESARVLSPCLPLPFPFSCHSALRPTSCTSRRPVGWIPVSTRARLLPHSTRHHRLVCRVRCPLPHDRARSPPEPATIDLTTSPVFMICRVRWIPLAKHDAPRPTARSIRRWTRLRCADRRHRACAPYPLAFATQ